MAAAEISQLAGIRTTLLNMWKSMAILQEIEGIDSQFSEALVKKGILDLRMLAETPFQTVDILLGNKNYIETFD
ncbi:MAG: hypothetical protein E3J35_02475 [Methanomassiliicoccales archaeon]|nr:MAG: hypothetical protein E3J35_02475 [Methanomassiliicoccales archaeon]